MVAFWIEPSDLGDYSNTQYAEEAAKAASYLLWAMSGRKYSGVTTVTERYTCVLRRSRTGLSSKNTDAVLFNGSVYDISKDDFEEDSVLSLDGISPDSRIKLRGGPVTKIHAIRNRNGLVLDPSSYYLVEHSTVQISAGVPWTPCNTEITYSYGNEPPVLGKMAARTLAIEFAKLWNGDDDCALPQRVTSVSRQGVSYTIFDNQEFIEELKTGLYAIDLFLKTVNPDKARNKAKVFSVDAPRGRRYTPKASVFTANTVTDMTVYSTGGTLAIGLANISAQFLVNQAGWTPSLTIKNHSSSRSSDLGAGSATVNSAASTITLSAGYTSTVEILGMVDPGQWALYATHTNNSVVLISSGNLKTSMVT
jgi:hypothetical protein